MKRIFSVLLSLILSVGLLCSVGCAPKDTITLTFDGQGGITKDGETVIKRKMTVGQDFLGPKFTYDEHNFVGWDKKLDDVTADTTLNAIWQDIAEQIITINFNLNGGTLVSGELSQQIGVGESAVPPECTREGYTLTGWRGVYTNVRESATVTAEWTPLYFEVTFNLNFGKNEYGETDGKVIDENTPQSGIITKRVAYGTTVIPPQVIRTGYSFAGWDQELEHITSSMVVNAQWIEESEQEYYTVTFDFSRCISDERLDVFVDDPRLLTQVVRRGEAAQYPSLLAKPYPHNLVGWDKYPGAVYGDMTVNALWEEAIFTITFNPSGGDLADNSAALTQYTSNGKIRELPTVSRVGYVFRRWSGRDSSGNIIYPDDVLETSDMITTSCTFTALWLLDENYSLSLTFDGNGGQTFDGNSAVTRNYSVEDIVSAPEFERDGYELIEWSLPLSSVRTHCIASGMTSLTVKALWREIWHESTEISFNGNGASIVLENIILRQGEKIPDLPSPTREPDANGEYFFVGWYYNVIRGGEKVAVRVEPGAVWNENLSTAQFYAQWVQGSRQTKISFEGLEDKMTFTIGEKIPTLPVPAARLGDNGEQYEFEYWYFERRIGYPETLVVVTAGNFWETPLELVELHAKWREIDTKETKSDMGEDFDETNIEKSDNNLMYVLSPEHIRAWV